MGIAKIFVLIKFLGNASLGAVIVTAACIEQLRKLCKNIVTYLV